MSVSEKLLTVLHMKMYQWNPSSYQLLETLICSNRKKNQQMLVGFRKFSHCAHEEVLVDHILYNIRERGNTFLALRNVTGFALCASVHVLAALKTSRIRSPYSSSTPSSFSTAPKKLLKILYCHTPQLEKSFYTLQITQRHHGQASNHPVLLLLLLSDAKPTKQKSLSCGEISMIRNNSKFRGSKKEKWKGLLI